MSYPTMGKGKASTQKCKLEGDMIVCMRVALICSLKQHIFLFTFLYFCWGVCRDEGPQNIGSSALRWGWGGPIGGVVFVRFDQRQITLAA